MLLDTSYLSRISHRLSGFVKVGRDSFWCRCPYCGDSKKDANRKRGHFRTLQNDSTKLRFKCYNCGISRTFRNFLRDTDETIFRDYIRESLTYSWGVGSRDESFWNVEPVKKQDPIRKYPLPDDYFTPIGDLDLDHPARAYLLGRKIPETAFGRIWYTDDFRSISNELDPTKFAEPGKIFPESRIVFPLMSIDGSRMIAFQGRAMDPESKVRYIMIMLDRSAPRLFGLEQINTAHDLLVVEGPIDSLFLDNCVALCGSTNMTEIPVKDPIFFLDQEPRNQQIVGRIKSLADEGRRVVLMPTEYQEKDINELILSGMKPEEIQNVAIQHTYKGLRARARLASWTT